MESLYGRLEVFIKAKGDIQKAQIQGDGQVSSKIAKCSPMPGPDLPIQSPVPGTLIRHLAHWAAPISISLALSLTPIT